VVIIKKWGCFARQKARTKIEELRNLRIEGFLPNSSAQQTGGQAGGQVGIGTKEKNRSSSLSDSICSNCSNRYGVPTVMFRSYILY
jgi:hypothetical protein